MVLFIDTSKQNKILIALIRQGDIFIKKEIKSPYIKGERLLLLIEQLLKKVNLSWPDLKGIIVITGPGGFTALRIGVTITNTLGLVLGIPAVGIKLKDRNNDQLSVIIKDGLIKLKKIKPGQIILPFYGQEPHLSLKT